jgi:hypothetical protein
VDGAELTPGLQGAEQPSFRFFLGLGLHGAEQPLIIESGFALLIVSGFGAPSSHLTIVSGFGAPSSRHSAAWRSFFSSLMRFHIGFMAARFSFHGLSPGSGSVRSLTIRS